MTGILCGVLSQQGDNYPNVYDVTMGTFATDVTTHNMTMPSSIASGDLLLAFAAMDDTSTITIPGGWTEVARRPYTTYVTVTVIGKVAGGTEGGTTVDFATTAAQAGGIIVYQIKNWHGTLASDVVIGALNSGSVSSSNHLSLTSGFGSVPTLWLAVSGTNLAPTGIPANYSYAPASQSYAGSAGATTLALVIVTWRKLTAASEDPDPYPLTGTARCAAVTGAVRGAL